MASEDEKNNHAAVPSHVIQALTNVFRGGVRVLREDIGNLREDLHSSEATTDTFRRSLPKAEATIVPDDQAELARTKDKYDELLKAYEQQALIISQLQSTRTRTGLKFGTPTDDEIINDFTRLKGAILQLVRNHIVAKRRNGMESIDKLWVQSQVASGLHKKYFAKPVRLFGFSSTEINDALQRLEMNAEILDYDESDLRNWRVATIQISQWLNDHQPVSEQPNHHQVATSIWNELLRPQLGAMPSVINELSKVCSISHKLAIKLRTARVEYRWDQDAEGFSRQAMPTDHPEIAVVRSLGRSRVPAGSLIFVTFGGLIRGDPITGLFKDGRSRLLPTEVVLS